MSDSNGIHLGSVPEISAEHLNRLSKAWITTVEQLVAISMTPNGLTSIAQHLGIDEKAARLLIDASRSKLGPDVIDRLKETGDTSRLSLGAILEPPTEEQPDKST